MLVDRRACRLDDEHIRASDVLVDLKRDLGIRKAMKTCGTHGGAEMLGNLPGERWMRASRKNLQLPVIHISSLGGFAPADPPTRSLGLPNQRRPCVARLILNQQMASVSAFLTCALCPLPFDLL